MRCSWCPIKMRKWVDTLETYTSFAVSTVACTACVDELLPTIHLWDLQWDETKRRDFSKKKYKQQRNCANVGTRTEEDDARELSRMTHDTNFAWTCSQTFPRIARSNFPTVRHRVKVSFERYASHYLLSVHTLNLDYFKDRSTILDWRSFRGWC